MKKLSLLLIFVLGLQLTTSAETEYFAEAEYLCDSIPFSPNKSAKESCGQYCQMPDADYYINTLYPKAKAMYQQGKCTKILLLRTYKGSCGETTYEYNTWSRLVGGDAKCLMERESRIQQKMFDDALNGKIEF